ncbi:MULTISPECIES: hypothetical protein [Persicobacter]|uniref:Uncharacterized protein n=1 Tax=Persicobacter diffluens TaxID=981 RepID=A0AAN4VX68_9BACT|nr:hypothetical protein [Persicobacter sp. CCB-QB2]GJM61358.1 hypothetical protein PEDI_19100 [Persicobacter diffluens]
MNNTYIIALFLVVFGSLLVICFVFLVSAPISPKMEFIGMLMTYIGLGVYLFGRWKATN